MTTDTGKPDAMTPAEAWQRYSYTRDPDEWHRQPVCECGDYITSHEKQWPYPCGFSHRPSMCRCTRYRFSRIRNGASPSLPL